jgi:hypothetical protein
MVMMRRIVMTFLAATSIVFLWGGLAGAASITVHPSTVVAGTTVTLSGDVLANGKPGCAVPGTVTLISGAFPGDQFGPGQGAVDLPVDAAGHYSGTAVLNPSGGPGTYSISGRCGGGNLGVTASVTVTELPRTGGSVGPLSDSQATALALALVVAGGAVAGVARRSRKARGARHHV